MTSPRETNKALKTNHHKWRSMKSWTKIQNNPLKEV